MQSCRLHSPCCNPHVAFAEHTSNLSDTSLVLRHRLRLRLRLTLRLTLTLTLTRRLKGLRMHLPRQPCDSLPLNPGCVKADQIQPKVGQNRPELMDFVLKLVDYIPEGTRCARRTRWMSEKRSARYRLQMRTRNQTSEKHPWKSGCGGLPAECTYLATAPPAMGTLSACSDRLAATSYQTCRYAAVLQCNRQGMRPRPVCDHKQSNRAHRRP